MKPAELSASDERVIQLQPIGDVPIEEGRGVRVSLSGGRVQLTGDGQVGLCLSTQRDDTEWLERVLASGAYVAELVSSGHGAADATQEVVVRVLTFDAVLSWPQGRTLGVDETTVEGVNRLRGRSDDIAKVLSWLTRQLVLEGDDPAFVASAGTGEVDDLGFRVWGASIAVDVAMNDNELLIVRVVSRHAIGTVPRTLIRGPLAVVDRSRMGRLTAEDRIELQRLSQANDAYLTIWREYSELERVAARRAAQDIGWAEYDHWTLEADGSIRFDLVQHTRSDALRERIGTETVGLEAGAGLAFDVRSDGASVIGTATVTPGGMVRLRPDRPVNSGDLPKHGKLSGAFTLDRVRLDRRDRARDVMAAAVTAPARQIALLLADKPLDPLGRARRHEPLSHRVQAILGGRPTAAQIRAIDLAVNSRDLVLIQGPPGTGKTRVIAAIQARLAEIDGDSSAAERRVLLTSYQHDAVANLVQAADDGVLPAVKLGRADGVEDEAYLIAWSNDLQTRLDHRHSEEAPQQVIQARRDLADRATAYFQQPFDVPGTLDLLGWLFDQALLVGDDVAREARRLARRVEQHVGAVGGSRSQVRLASLVRALRTTARGYEDDGRLTAAHAYHTRLVFDLLNDQQRRSLEAAALGQDTEVAVEHLRAIKEWLLDRMLDARARSSVVATMPEVEALLLRAGLAADAAVERWTTPTERVVADFRDAVAHQPHTVRASIVRHTRALAATCQQSVSGSMRDSQPVPFDTVIIDEAARANPLDLMVPISLALQRVVLVGDHRQLPQLLEEEIVDELSVNRDEALVEQTLARSLFERLFVGLRESDLGGPVKRVVTLDKQFRMHPVLGDFVSAQFYAPHGEDLTNGDPSPEPFAHGLGRYADAVCGWIDVPQHKGPALRSGTSLSRQAEAQVIVAELKHSLGEDRNLTFGVITFYSGQVSALWHEMVEAGLAVRDGGAFSLNPSVPWLFTERGLPRVRIGSVDAFQGREFDVVFLSTTRSGAPRPSRPASFGFLTLPNRLCVAMSRQRRLLIVVGDATFLASADGRRAVPALAAFHDLTGGAHGFRRTA